MSKLYNYISAILNISQKIWFEAEILSFPTRNHIQQKKNSYKIQDKKMILILLLTYIYKN